MAGIHAYSDTSWLGVSDSNGVIKTKISSLSSHVKLTFMDSEGYRDTLFIEDYLSTVTNSYTAIMYPNQKYEDIIWAQEDSLFGTVIKEDHTSEVVDSTLIGDKTNEAKFIGGQEALVNYINDEIVINYLERVNQQVDVRFIVEPNGKISHVVCANEVPRGLEREAIRLVRNMPNWSPGIRDGKPCRTRTRLPINIENN